MKLEIKVEEVENGFRFKDPEVEIKVVKEGNKYKELWTNNKGETTSRLLQNVTSHQEAYKEFRLSISDYWSHSLGIFFEMSNSEKISKLFEPLAKYK